MDSQRQHYLQAMGIPLWQLRRPQQPKVVERAQLKADVPPEPVMASAVADLPATEPAVLQNSCADLDWETLQQRVQNCRECALHEGRNQTVFGAGDPHANWMFVGEAPGAEEDRLGQPFVGRAGKLLNAMLHALKLQRDQVYIANVLKCRPPNNRDPRPEEVMRCEGYLLRQVELVQPKLIVALGRVAAQNLLKTDQSLGKLRGQVFHYGEHNTPLIATYHPAYLLRNPADKRKTWQDLCLARKLVNNPHRE